MVVQGEIICFPCQKILQGIQRATNITKATVFKDGSQGSNLITNPEEDEEEKNEGDPEGGYVNEEHLMRILAVRAAVETGWNC